MAKTHEAIYQLYPTVKSITEDVEGSFVCKDIDGNDVAINESDVSNKANELETADADAKAQKETDKANAKAKLMAGEALTEAEADTIVL